MQITLKEISVRELVQDYKDLAENGVTGYGGKLDIRPPYQREFIYKDAQREAVIDTVLKNFPLNVMYWAERQDGTYEVMDGQQRTISICQYVQGEFAFDMLYFHNLPDDKREKILNYKLMVYFCQGTDSEKLDWFKTINIAGEELTDQELLNAVYHGSWVSDAKRYFSKTGCPAYGLASDYLTGSPIRQDYLETAIDWLSQGEIKKYMADHQRDPNANELWLYFQSVINWVKVNFPTYRKEMKGICWGELFNEFKNKKLDARKMENTIALLMQDDDVTNKKGIYYYILTKQEKYLNIRTFTPAMKRKMYEAQAGICPHCKKHFELEEMEADHVTPWHEGGKTELSNGQMLCKECNRRKSGK